MYITYGNGVGPHGHWDPASETMTEGAVWKYVPTGNVWTNITPGVASAYGGVSVDPTNANRVIVSTINKYLQQPWGWGDRIFVSTNGGSAWTDLIGSNKVAMSNNGIPWIDGHAIHWAGCVTIDPFNTERVFVTSGNGIFMTENISAATSTWSFMAKGIEETVPLDIVSCINGPVVTVIGDYDGSVYSDLETYPTLHNPQIGTTTGIDVSADNSLMVRVGGATDGSNFPIYYSTNKGSTWTAFSSKPNNSNFYKGKAAVSSNGATVIWAPENSSTLYKTTNRGGSWTTVSGISLTNAYPVADGVNANKFYIANGNTIYVSTNAGTSFSAAGTTANTDLKKIRAVPGVEGDIWAPTGTNGLYRSTNSGTSFTKINTVTACSAIGFGKAAPSKTFPTVYIWGTVSGVTGIFRSIDAGATWVRINDDAHEYGGTANGQFVIGDMNTYGTVYMSTAGRGTVVGTVSVSDTQAPTTPGTITFSAITQNSFTASWTASTDNVGVVGYEVLLNGTLYATVTTNSISVTGLTCNTSYSVRVRAKDAAGNFSAYNTQVSTTTTGVAAPTITNTTPTICAGGTISLSIPTTTGATYAWTGPSSYSATTAAISRTNATTAMGGTYSATVTVNGCTSTASSTTVTVNAIPVAPTVTSPIVYEQGTSAIPLTASGNSLLWYTVATGGNASSSAPTPSTALIGTTIYYVSQTINSCESPRALVIVQVVQPPITQTIELQSGWNLISIQVQPSDSSFETIFNGLQVQTVKNAQGFWRKDNPTQLNSIHKIMPCQGYLVYMTAPGTLQIIGKSCNSDLFISPSSGWQLIGYPCIGLSIFSNIPFQSSLEISNNCQIIKNFDGFWEPNGSSNSIQNFEQGKGYYVLKK
ncbi:MAG TPA: fibronectin type III domain-containing protein [Bacteroidales bacterium]|nr:fibronectin type III domain-containing protein [Bacteroidales bacterium]